MYHIYVYHGTDHRQPIFLLFVTSPPFNIPWLPLFSPFVSNDSCTLLTFCQSHHYDRCRSTLLGSIWLEHVQFWYPLSTVAAYDIQLRRNVFLNSMEKKHDETNAKKLNRMPRIQYILFKSDAISYGMFAFFSAFPSLLTTCSLFL